MARRLGAAPLALLGMSPALASDIDDRINAAVTPIATAFSDAIFFEVNLNGTGFPLIVGWLILAALIGRVRRFGLSSTRPWRRSIRALSPGLDEQLRNSRQHLTQPVRAAQMRSLSGTCFTCARSVLPGGRVPSQLA